MTGAPGRHDPGSSLKHGGGLLKPANIMLLLDGLPAPRTGRGRQHCGYAWLSRGAPGGPVGYRPAHAEHVRRHLRGHPSAGLVRLGHADSLLHRAGRSSRSTASTATTSSAPISSTARRPSASRPQRFEKLPPVTIQLPLYNERYVVERLIEEVVKIDYPKELLQIQVLDDSTDDTAPFAEALVERYRAHGVSHRISPPHQPPRLQGRRPAGGPGNRHRRVRGRVRRRFLPAGRFPACAPSTTSPIPRWAWCRRAGAT